MMQAAPVPEGSVQKTVTVSAPGPAPSRQPEELVLVVPPTSNWVAPGANVLLSLCFIVFLLAPLIAFASCFVVNGTLREESRILQENSIPRSGSGFCQRPIDFSTS